jgi:hypothetical protein
MQFNQLPAEKQIDPSRALVLRHRPIERNLRKIFPWLAEERPSIYNAYQQAQNQHVEKAMARANYVASFIGHEAKKALFIGLYEVRSSKPISYKQYWKIAANQELRSLGMAGFSGARPSILWFDLRLMDFYKDWKGKLIVQWPPPERSWWRKANRNNFLIEAILEEGLLNKAMPPWESLLLTWDELKILPARWRADLAQWRGIYLIFDASTGEAYVGSAYGADNILGRWLNYSKSGHGGNKQLRDRSPKNLHFSILQRVSPDLESSEVIRLESSCKDRLHTREFGLNSN